MVLSVVGLREDPYRGFKFRVVIEGFVTAGFHQVTGLRDETEVIEYREGTDGGQVRKLPGLTKSDNIILEKGISKNNDMQQWRNQVTIAPFGPDGLPDPLYRKDILIQLREKTGLVNVKEWIVFGCWPAIWELDDLNAEDSTVAMERIELANEGHALLSLSQFGI